MATGKGLICKLGKHIPIEGADKIVQVDMFGETIITQKGNSEGIIGILFDMETCLSHEYASKNNMYRHSHLNENKSITGYLEDDRRIRPVRLKGIKCSALFMPLYSVESFGKHDKIDIGQEIDTYNGVKICEKYIAQKTREASMRNKEGKAKLNLTPTFKEHIDTDQWARNSHKVQEGDLVIITEKLHGTSGRCGYLPVIEKKSWWWSLWVSIAYFMTHFNFVPWHKIRNTNKNYNFVVGSRRVVKSIGGNEAENKAHFYDEDLWTKVSKENFEGKLRKGETVYFEIVGYTPSGESIMSSVSNKKLEKFLSKEEYKDFIERYGDATTFSYGCNKDINQHVLENERQNFYKIFVYRITMTNEDGDSIDYSWDQVKRRCEQLGVNHVPELDRLPLYNKKRSIEEYKEMLDEVINELTNSESLHFPNHIREGVCIRIENGGMTPLILKNKSFIFKVLEGIIKDNDIVDIEESN